MSEAPKLGIIAGGGSLPFQLAQHCSEQNRPYFMLGLEEAVDRVQLEAHPHHCIRLGAVGEGLEALHEAGAQEVVLAGQVKRPSMSQLKPDAAGARLVARLGLKLFGGDDAVLKTLIKFFEEEGFKVVGADDILDGLLMPQGVLTTTAPDKQAQEDIHSAMTVARAMGELDVGQAVIIENGYVLGVEAAEGTDALIKRCASLQRDTKRAVLIKLRKPGQEERADLPSIGPQTISRLHECGMLGVAMEANGSLLLERSETLELADKHGVFVIGVSAA